MMLLRTLILCVFVFAPTFMLAQGSLFLRSFSTDSAGNQLAAAVYFDPSGRITNFEASDVTITYGKTPARVIRVTCTPPERSPDVSSVLTIDVSGSMRFGGPNIALAQAAAQAWVKAISGESECAVTAFDDGVLLQSDFTTDKDRLTSAINRLRPRGGTSYDRGFLDPVMGGLAIAREGRHRKVMVFLTDGFGSVNPDSVVAMAQANGITVYCVTLGLNMPGVLQSIAERTGGLWFDNVTTVDQAVMAYQRIFADATGAGGCEIVWEPPVVCESFSAVTAQVHGTTYTTTLPTLPTRKGGFNVNTTAIRFDSVEQDFREFRILPLSNKAVIRSIHLDSPSPFAIVHPQLPIELSADDTLVIRVRCTRLDSSYIVSTLEVNAYPCPLPTLYVAAGNPQSRPQTPTLRVVHPNGGERFVVRSDTVLQWEGLPPDVPVKLEVSYNGGKTWDVIADNATKHRYKWRVPNRESDSCLLRASHVREQKDRTNPVLTIPGGHFSDVAFSPDGSLLVTAEEPSKQGGADRLPPATIWNGQTGAEVRKLKAAEQVLFSADGSRLLTWSRDSVSFYSMPSGAHLWSLPVSRLPLRCVMDKSARVVVIGGADGDRTVVVNASDGKPTYTLPRRWPSICWVDVSANGKYIAVCERDSMVSVYEYGDTVGRKVKAPGVERFYRAAFSPDARKLVTTDSYGAATMWDVATLATPQRIATRQFKNDNTYLTFTPDARRLAVETGKDETKIIDVATGEHVVSIRRLSEPGGASEATILPDGTTLLLSTLSFANVFDAHTGVQLLRVQRGYGNPTAPADGRRLAVIGPSRQVHVYNLETPLLQQDVSDRLWSIYRPLARLKPVRFRERAVGQSVDSIVIDGIENPSSSSITIKGIRIEGAQAADFGVNAPKEFVLGPGEVRPLTFSFHPHAVGERAALIVAESAGGIISARITGRCMGGVIAAGADMRDLGVVGIAVPTTIRVDSLIANQGLQLVTVTGMRIAEGSDPAISLPLQPSFQLLPGERKSFDVVVTAPTVGRYATQIEFDIAGLDEPLIARLFVRADSSVRMALTGADPTTFRSIMLPTAVVPPRGTIVTGVYDVLGLMAGYSITNNVAVLVGGALPLFNRWFGATGYDASWSAAWSIGGKVGYEIANNVIAGGGYQFGQSYYDQDYSPQLESKITFHALWTTAGYGDDDSRLNLYLGYAFKDHVTLADGEFRADAFLGGIAYDYRFADNWKVCAEAFYMRTMTFVPLTLTARYFRTHDAFEVGLSYVGIRSADADSGGWPIVPMLTWVKRW